MTAKKPSGPRVITGTSYNRNVAVDGVELKPTESLQVIAYSPDGFNWGYGGSGPAQLALAILLLYVDKDEATRLVQDFKFDIVAKLPNDFVLDGTTIVDWIEKHKKGGKRGQAK